MSASRHARRHRDPGVARWRIPARTLAAGAALIGVTLVVAACGSSGGSSPGVATVASSTTASPSTTVSSSTAAGSSSPAVGTAGGGAIGGGGGSAGAPNGAHAVLAIAGGNGSNLLKLAACMRANGEPSFPDPNAQGQIQLTGINPQSSQFQAAQNRCRRFLPNKGAPPSPAQQQSFDAKAIAFSACMRSHGVPDFPDPQISGGHVALRIHATAGGALNPNSPAFQKAMKDCQADQPGFAKGVQIPTGG